MPREQDPSNLIEGQPCGGALPALGRQNLPVPPAVVIDPLPHAVNERVVIDLVEEEGIVVPTDPGGCPYYQ